MHVRNHTIDREPLGSAEEVEGRAVGGAAAAASLGANLAAGAGKTYTSSTGVMAKRSAKQTVAYMSQFFATQGWIPQTMVQTADTNGATTTPGLRAF